MDLYQTGSFDCGKFFIWIFWLHLHIFVCNSEKYWSLIRLIKCSGNSLLREFRFFGLVSCSGPFRKVIRHISVLAAKGIIMVISLVGMRIRWIFWKYSEFAIGILKAKIISSLRLFQLLNVMNKHLYQVLCFLYIMV